MLVQKAINNGGSLHPLLLPHSVTNGGGVMNPSVFNDGGKILCNVRVVNYALYHSRNYPHKYGPLQYLHEEDNIALDTKNVLCELNDDLSIKSFKEVDTSKLDTKPQWNFTGLEDARLVRWDGELTLAGVRRDTDPTGKGRIEMSTIDEEGVETDRLRIEPPVDSYCEKNWMPILSRPKVFIKWTNPTEILWLNDDLSSSSEIVGKKDVVLPRDLRGGSQLVPFKDGFICVVHEAALYKSQLGQKDATYLHRVVTFDNRLSILNISEPFCFLGGDIEFCCGLAVQDNDFLVSFGYQDSSAFILKLPISLLEEMIC